MAILTLGEAVDNTLEALGEKVPDVADLFRKEYNKLLSSHNMLWREQPESIVTGLFPELLAKMKRVLAALPQ